MFDTFQDTVFKNCVIMLLYSALSIFNELNLVKTSVGN